MESVNASIRAVLADATRPLKSADEAETIGQGVLGAPMYTGDSPPERFLGSSKWSWAVALLEFR